MGGTRKEIIQPKGSSFISSRIPSIKFLGKKGWLKRLHQTDPTSYSSNITNFYQSQSSELIHIHKSNISKSAIFLADSTMATKLDVDNSFYDDHDRSYRRLKISDREFEAIITGGASELP